MRQERRSTSVRVLRRTDDMQGLVDERAGQGVVHHLQLTVDLLVPAVRPRIQPSCTLLFHLTQHQIHRGEHKRLLSPKPPMTVRFLQDIWGVSSDQTSTSASRHDNHKSSYLILIVEQATKLREELRLQLLLVQHPPLTRMRDGDGSPSRTPVPLPLPALLPPPTL